MTIEETIDGLRTLYLDKHTQSEISVVGKDDGKDLFAKLSHLSWFRSCDRGWDGSMGSRPRRRALFQACC